MDHIPVLLDAALATLKPQPSHRILDVTLGLGGHAKAFLGAIGDTAELVGLDADSDNLQVAKTVLAESPGQKAYIHANFCKLPMLDLGLFDIIFADLGISSVHLDDPSKGFSFRADGPLDMRLDRTSGKTCTQLIADSSAKDIQLILQNFGELRQSKTLSEVIKGAEPTTTSALSACIEQRLGFRAKDVIPQVFQAFRIAVNGELDALRVLLDTAPAMLNESGVLGIIAFHSLEDRMVKQHFKKLSTPVKDEYTGGIAVEAEYDLVERKAIKPTDDEIAQNPRSRSARLRVLRKRPYTTIDHA